jgi:hypothetical protein
MLRTLMNEVPEKHVDLKLVLPQYELAIARAQRLENEAAEANEDCRNPTSEVFHVVNSIDEAGHKQRMARLRRRNEESRAKADAAADAAQALVASQSEDSHE